MWKASKWMLKAFGVSAGHRNAKRSLFCEKLKLGERQAVSNFFLWNYGASTLISYLKRTENPFAGVKSVDMLIKHFFQHNGHTKQIDVYSLFHSIKKKHLINLNCQFSLFSSGSLNMPVVTMNNFLLSSLSSLLSHQLIFFFFN